MREKDPLAIGLGALACGIGLGGGAIALTLTAVRAFQHVDLTRYGEAVSDTSLDITAGLAAGIALAAVFGWRRSRPLDNDWQRGVIGVLSAVGALIMAFLAVPFWHFLRFPGLIVWAAANLALGFAGSAWAIRGKGDGEGGSAPS